MKSQEKNKENIVNKENTENKTTTGNKNVKMGMTKKPYMVHHATPTLDGKNKKK